MLSWLVFRKLTLRQRLVHSILLGRALVIKTCSKKALGWRNRTVRQTWWEPWKTPQVSPELKVALHWALMIMDCVITTPPQSLMVGCPRKDMTILKALWSQSLPQGAHIPYRRLSTESTLGNEDRCPLLSLWVVHLGIHYACAHIVLQEGQYKVKIVALTLLPDLETWICLLLSKVLNFSVILSCEKWRW